MTAITDYPRCAAYLKAMDVRFDADMMPKHYAWLLGDAAFGEKALEDMGAKGLPMAEWGSLLPAMEASFETRNRKPKLSKSQWNKLVGMMVCYGFKGSAIKDDADAIELARALWGSEIRKSDKTARDVLERIEGMRKKHRSAVARSRLDKVPAKFWSAA